MNRNIAELQKQNLTNWQSDLAGKQYLKDWFRILDNSLPAYCSIFGMTPAERAEFVCDAQAELKDLETARRLCLLKCDNCGSWHGADESERHAGKDICPDCWEDRHVCDHCGEITFDDSDFTWIESRQETLCDSCRDRFCRYCEICETYAERGDCHHYGRNGGYICESCLRDGEYFTCEGCGNIFHNDDAHCEEEDYNNSYCGRCWEEHRPRAVSSYNTRINNGRLNPKVENFGIELETECEDTSPTVAAESLLAKIPQGDIICKDDGSLDNGFEVVTRALPYKEACALLEKIGKARPSGCVSWSAKTTGLHIHVSKKPLSDLRIAKILVLLNSYRFAGLRDFIARRSPNTYCEIKTKKFSDVKKPETRYEALNLTNENTIEFRLFKGTWNSKTLLSYLQFVESLLRWSEVASLPDAHDPKTWLAYAAANWKSYPELTARLVRGGFIPAPKGFKADTENQNKD